MVNANRKRIIVLVVVAIFIWLSTSAHSAQLLLRPELIVSEEYNDNIFLSPDNEEDDFITSAGIGLTGQILGRTSGFELNYTPTFNSFAYNSDLNYWRHEARVQLNKSFSRNTRIELTDNYLETEDPLDESQDFSPEDPTTGPGVDPDRLRRGRDRYRTNRASAVMTHQFGPRDNVSLAMRYNFHEDIDTYPGVRVEDYTELRPSLGLDYWFSQRWGMELDGYYSKRNYEERNDRNEYTGYLRLLHALNRNLSGYLEYRHTELYYDRDYDPDEDIDYKTYIPSVGIRYNLGERSYFTLSVGYLFQELDDVENDYDDYGWLINSEIAKRWSFQTSYLEVVGGSGYQVEDTGVQDLGLNIYYTGRVTLGYAFSSRINTEIYGGYRYDDYPNEEPDRVDQNVNAGAVIGYQALQWMNLQLAYRFRDQYSDIESEEYTENRVTFTISIAPVGPYRLN